MRYCGKLEQKLQTQLLRSQGYSYKEILKEKSVSKDTISRLHRDISLLEEQKTRLLNNKSLGQRKGLIIAA